MSDEFGGMLAQPLPANDHALLRQVLEDVELGCEGHVLSGNCEYAEGAGDPGQIDTSNRLYALWERQERDNNQKETQ